MSYTTITDAAQIAAIDPATFTGAYIGRRYEDGFLDSTQGYVVRLVERGFSPSASGIDDHVRVTGTSPLMWGEGNAEEIRVEAVVVGQVGPGIDWHTVRARAAFKREAASR